MVIQEFKTPSGVTIKFNNSSYEGKTEEEKQTLRKNLETVITAIIFKNN